MKSPTNRCSQRGLRPSFCEKSLVGGCHQPRVAEFWTFGGDLHSMKNIIETSALLAYVLVAGCAGDGFNRSTDRSQSPLTAEELSRLLDLHVYKARIPPSQQPFRSLRLILIKHDGSSLKE